MYSVDGYHNMLLALQTDLESEYTEESTKEFLQLVTDADVDRIKRTWVQVSSVNSTAATAKHNDSLMRHQRTADLNMIFYELLTQPRLLRDIRFLKPFHKV
jgi:hypothetical protein